MKKLKYIILSLLALLIMSSNAFATHVAGGNITYLKLLQPNTYEITLTLYEACSGNIQLTSNDGRISSANTCGLQNFSNYLLQYMGSQDVSQLCPSYVWQSECNGGSWPGYKMHVWKSTIVLPGACDSWTFNFSECCRNSSTNLVGTGNFYIETDLNSITSPQNSSSVITTPKPIPYYILGQQVTYNLGVYDPDGDLLAFSFVGVLNNSGSYCAYQPGYSANDPLLGITIDSQSGDISFTPSLQGFFVVGVLIEEFNSNGDLVGSVVQDFQIIIIDDPNVIPEVSNAGISNLNSGTVINPFEIQVCEGSNVCFDLEFLDQAPYNTLNITSNISQVIPGATMIQNNNVAPVIVTFCFTAPLVAVNPILTFSIDVNDNACPIVGINSKTVDVKIVSSTYASQDVNICKGDNIQLFAVGGTMFNWSVISGDPIDLGSNFNYNNRNHSSVFVSPDSTTTYEVISDVIGCRNMDLVQVVVSDISSDPFIQFVSCEGENDGVVDYGIYGGVEPYVFNWGHSNSNLDSLDNLFAGIYLLSVVDDIGCTRQFDTLITNLYDKPLTNFTWGPSNPSSMNPVIEFYNNTSNAISYQWEIDVNGTIMTFDAENIDYMFPYVQSGEYPVCLTAISEYGCDSTYCGLVEIQEEFLMYIPNAFTPGDNDFVNNEFKPIITGVDPNYYSFQIFNRNGELIFESTNVDDGWNGYYNGELCQIGGYVWKMTMLDQSTTNSYENIGNVTLLR
mgnify:CR=1 FL=1